MHVLNAPLPMSGIEPAPTLMFLVTVSLPSCTGSRIVTLKCILSQGGCRATVRCTRACVVRSKALPRCYKSFSGKHSRSLRYVSSQAFHV